MLANALTFLSIYHLPPSPLKSGPTNKAQQKCYQPKYARLFKMTSQTSHKDCVISLHLVLLGQSLLEPRYHGMEKSSQPWSVLLRRAICIGTNSGHQSLLNSQFAASTNWAAMCLAILEKNSPASCWMLPLHRTPTFHAKLFTNYPFLNSLSISKLTAVSNYCFGKACYVAIDS